MKGYKLLRYLIPVFAAAALLWSASSVSAQDPAAGQGRRGGGRGAGGAGGAGGFGGAQLSPDAQTANTDIAAGLTAEIAKLTQARTDLYDAIYAAKVDEAAIKAKAAAVGTAEADLGVARAKLFDKSRTKFTADDVTALKAQGVRGGGGGRGGRAGGGRRGAGQ